MTPKFNTFDEFWPHYLEQHAHPLTQYMHLTGTIGLIPLIVLGFTESWVFWLFLPLCGYGFAWVSHAFIERNKPATFDYPFWSLLADFKMCYYLLLFKKLK